jgi:DNA-binding transcriptional LysR family regulator
MDHLSTLNTFVHAAETGSFVAAGRQIGLTASAVGKAVARLEQRLGVRLFHRDTRNMTLTQEGRLFLDRCRRIFEEIEAAEMELSETSAMPRGRLKVSFPLGALFMMPIIGDFMATYPDIQLDLDFSDRIVDVIEEGFDIAVRTGATSDSGLMRRSLGKFSGQLVASPRYLEQFGIPQGPTDLLTHACLRQRSPATGKLHEWALRDGPKGLPETMSATTIAPLLELALCDRGIAFLPPFAIASHIANGRLVSVLKRHIYQSGEIAALWPTSRQLSPRIRAFVDFMADRLQREDYFNNRS